MEYVYMIVLALHVMAGVFWAGTTFTLARASEIRAEKFFGPQMGSAGLAFVTGGLLWYFFHNGVFSGMETVLAIGILAAIAAAGVLGATVGPARRQLAGANPATETALRSRMASGEQTAARLLLLTVICMAIARMF